MAKTPFSARKIALWLSASPREPSGAGQTPSIVAMPEGNTTASSPRAPPSPQPGAHLALGTANVLLLPCQEVLASLSYSLITIQRVAQRELANSPSRVGRRQESDFAPKPLCFGTSSLLEDFPSRASGKKGFFPFFWTRSDLTVFPQHGSWQNVLIRRLRLQEM